MESVPEAEFLGFAREYFRGHPEMREAFRKRGAVAKKVKAAAAFVKATATFDCEKEVASCYTHWMKQVRWERDWRRQPEYLDWESVGSDLSRLLRRAEALVAEGKEELAVETALRIMETNSRLYEEEFLGEREDWSEEDFCTEECVSLIRKAYESAEWEKSRILEVCDRLERLETSPVFYEDDYGCEDLVDEMRRATVSDEEYLEILKRSFRNADSWRKEEAACEVWDFLVDAGREREAVAFLREHKESDGLRERYVELLSSRKAYKEALKVADEGVRMALDKDLFGNVSKWLRVKLDLFEALGEKKSEIAVLFKLLDYGFGGSVREYYHKLKSLVGPEEWNACREKMLGILQKDYAGPADSVLAEIYVEEGLLDRLYQHLMSADLGVFEGVERYAKLFDKEKQQQLVARLERDFRSGLAANPTRKSYQNLAVQLKRLARICPAGNKLATELRDYYLTTYPNRPALREELGRVRW